MTPNRLKIGLQLSLGALTALLVLYLIYQLPLVQHRLAWRVDLLLTRLRVAMDPVGVLPTPGVQDNLDTDQVIAPSSTPPALTPSAATGGQDTAGQNPEIRPSAIPFLSPSASPTLAPSPAPLPMPSQVNLPAPAYEREDWNNCGPAALALALRFYGWKGDQYAISDQVKPVRADRNVNIDELLQFVLQNVPTLRAQFRVGGDPDLLRRAVTQGIPVLVEVSFRLAESFWYQDDLWAGHYLFVTGYDDTPQEFTVQDVFVGPDRRASYANLDSAWQSFNRAYLVIYRPEQEEAVKALLGSSWDADRNRQLALEKALAETQKDPKNALAWFNLGSNLVYFDRYVEAAKAYDTARKLGLPQRMLRYQFGPFLAYFHAGRNDDLLALTEYALKVTPNSEEALLWRGWAIYRAGDRNAALELFRQALKAHPGYRDAQYALEFVNNN